MSLLGSATLSTLVAASQALSGTNIIHDITREVEGISASSSLSQAHTSAFHGNPIIVLGARLNPDCAPPAVLNERLDRAAAFVRLHPFNRVVVTGGRTQGGCFTEAKAMEILLRARLVVNPIVREDKSGSTVENARNVSRMIADKQAVLITSANHVARAARNFAQVGITTTPVSAF